MAVAAGNCGHSQRMVVASVLLCSWLMLAKCLCLKMRRMPSEKESVLDVDQVAAEWFGLQCMMLDKPVEELD